MLFASPSTEDRNKADEASKDVKSDRDGKSPAPGLPPEASCSGLILCESMCSGLDCVTPRAALSGINSLVLALSSTHPLMFLLGLAQVSLSYCTGSGLLVRLMLCVTDPISAYGTESQR